MLKNLMGRKNDSYFVSFSVLGLVWFFVVVVWLVLWGFLFGVFLGGVGVEEMFFTCMESIRG